MLSYMLLNPRATFAPSGAPRVKSHLLHEAFLCGVVEVCVCLFLAAMTPCVFFLSSGSPFQEQWAVRRFPSTPLHYEQLTESEDCGQVGG